MLGYKWVRRVDENTVEIVDKNEPGARPSPLVWRNTFAPEGDSPCKGSMINRVGAFALAHEQFVAEQVLQQAKPPEEQNLPLAMPYQTDPVRKGYVVVSPPPCSDAEEAYLIDCIEELQRVFHDKMVKYTNHSGDLVQKRVLIEVINTVVGWEEAEGWANAHSRVLELTDIYACVILGYYIRLLSFYLQYKSTCEYKTMCTNFEVTKHIVLIL